jgi:hypothetical protein
MSLRSDSDMLVAHASQPTHELYTGPEHAWRLGLRLCYPVNWRESSTRKEMAALYLSTLASLPSRFAYQSYTTSAFCKEWMEVSPRRTTTRSAKHM